MVSVTLLVLPDLDPFNRRAVTASVSGELPHQFRQHHRLSMLDIQGIVPGAAMRTGSYCRLAVERQT
jgi:hypothetical protein